MGRSTILIIVLVGLALLAGSAASPPAPPGPRPEAAVGVPLAFDALHFGTNDGVGDSQTPPDVQVAVGPNHVVEMVNGLVGIWTKQGAHVSTVTIGSFFSAGGHSLSDPRLQFDAPTGRWVASIADFTRQAVLLAFSSGTDPTAGWNLYALPSAYPCPDHPNLGISDDKVTVAANDFPSCTTQGSFAGAQYWVVSKADLLAGSPSPNYYTPGADPSLVALQPVQSLGGTTTQYVVSVAPGSTNRLQLIALTGLPPATVSRRITSFTVRTVTSPPSALQPGGGTPLDTGDGRVLDALWFRGSLWLSLNDACIPSGDARTRSCVRVIEVNTTTNVVHQDIELGAVGKYYMYPALRVDRWGNPVVVFGYSSASDYPGVMVTSRATGETLNTLEAPTLLRAGGGSLVQGCDVSTCRYGDYFGAAVDPSDPSVVWVGGEYATAQGWATHVASVALTASLTASYAVDGGGVGYGIPSLTYTYRGVNHTVALGDQPVRYDVDPGAPWNVTQDLPGSTTQERWHTPGASGFGAGAQTLRFVYRHQYLVLMAADPRGAGAIGPGSGWYNASEALNLSAHAAFAWHFVGWNGTGPGAYTGPNATATLMPNGPLQEVATFQPSGLITAWPALLFMALAMIIVVAIPVGIVRRGRPRAPAHPPPPPDGWDPPRFPPPGAEPPGP